MPAIGPRALDSWSPGTAPSALAGVRVVLIHGGDEGGICGLAADLTRAEGPAVRLAADGLVASELRARMATGGLFGPATPVRVSGANDKHVGMFEKAVTLTDGALLVVEAGALKKDSKLKTLFEKLGASVALAPIEGAAAGAWISKACSAAGLPMAKGALMGALERLPSDRMRLTRMAEVLVLHALGRKAEAVEAVDVAAIVGQEADVDLTQALGCALAGDLAGAIRALDTQLGIGENPIALTRAWSWKLQRLDDMVRSGLKPGAAVAAARPPVFFSERESTERAIKRLGSAGVGAAVEGLDAAERGVVHQGHPARVALERWLMKLATWKGAA